MGAGGLIHLVVLTHVGAAPAWLVFVTLMGFVYPQLVTLAALSSRHPLTVTYAALFIEVAFVVVVAELLAFDMVYLVTTAAIMLVNASSTAGLGAAVASALTGLATALTVAGLLRLDDAPTLNTAHHVLFLILTVGYQILIGTQLFRLTRKILRERRHALHQQARLEKLHGYLLECIVTPYMTDQQLIEVIGQELDKDDIQVYLARFRQRQRLEARGRKSDEIFHDLRNLLQPIVSMSQFLMEDSDEEDVAVIFEASMQASMLLQESREQLQRPLDAQNGCDPDEVIRSVVSILNITAPEPIDITYKSTLERQVTVPARPIQLHRAITNLCRNAIEAMAQTGGQLKVHLDELQRSPHRLGDDAPPDAEGGVIIRVSDDGPGIPQDIAEHLFEPYFTTRAEQGGTGLGLATVYAIVQDAGGTIVLDHDQPRGASFVVSLPSR